MATSGGGLSPGARVGAYRIEGVLGRGGMGVVYLAEHEQLARKAAVKVVSADLRDDEEFRARFLHEARILAALDHPNVIPVYDAGESPDGALYLAMRFVSDGDLRHLLLREGALAPERAARIAVAVADGLSAAHNAGVIHRDVKPGNVLVELQPGGRERVYLADFGLVREQSGGSVAASTTGTMVGTVDCMAPEQITGDPIDQRGDVYSLGCVLFQLLTARTPYRGSEIAVMHAQLHDPIPTPSDHDRALAPFDPIIARAMAKHPEDRYQTAAELAAGSARTRHHRPSRRRRLATSARRSRPSPRSPSRLSSRQSRAFLLWIAGRRGRRRFCR